MSYQGFRLAPQQRHLWPLQQEGSALRAQSAILIEGEIEADRLRQAVHQIVARHDILRTVFRRPPGIRTPLQVVADIGPDWESVDLTGQTSEVQEGRLQELSASASRHPFDLEQGPLVHAWDVVLAADRRVLLLSLPALCADLGTLCNFAGELRQLLSGAELPPQDVQYVSFSEWQNDLLEDEEARKGQERWLQQDLSAAARLRLPLTAPGKDGHGGIPGVVFCFLPPALAGRVDTVAADLGVSGSSVLLACWQALLARLAGEDAGVIGLVADGRQFDELRNAMGPFSKVLPLSYAYDGGEPFAALVRRVEAAAAEAFDQQSFFVPNGAAPNRGNDALPFCFERQELHEEAAAGGPSVRIASWFAHIDRFELKLACVHSAGTLTAELHYDQERFDRDAVEALGARLVAFLEQAVAAPEAAIGAADLLLPHERRLLDEVNATSAPFPADRCVHDLIREQAERFPERIAVTADDRRLTYAELDRQAERLARRLRALGVGPDSVVGLFLPRSPELVIGLLGTLKAGGSYLPLDPRQPAERTAYMLQDAGARVLLTEERLRGALPGPSLETLCLDTLDEDDATGVAETAAQGLPAGPENLAYVMYTSGSTGRPKGVMIPHRGVVNYLSWAVEAYGVRNGNGAPVHSPVTFDLTVTSLLAPLAAGGNALLLPEEQGVDALSTALRDGGGFSLVKLTPPHLEILRQELKPGEVAGRTGALVLGGEALFGESLAFWRENAPETRLINEYGPTETVVGCCVYAVAPGAVPAGPVPIGRPIANTRVQLLDRHGMPVPQGVTGELYISGSGLARGYLGQAAVTAERFVPASFTDEPGARLYRTGDLARWIPGGQLEYLGRTDHQVKVRGYRIELGEIEAVLSGHPQVRECAVLAREDTPGERRLAAYLVTAPPAPGVDDLRRFLDEKLPDYMVPSAFVFLPALPLTRNGKVDRAALPVPGPERPELEQVYVAPRTPVEEVLAAIWAEVLGVEKVGVNDSFFALGGDSIRSVRVVAQAQERGLDFIVQDLFQRQTIAQLAEKLQENLGAAADPAPVERSTDEDLSRTLESLESLSEEEVRELLKVKAQSLRETNPA